MISFFEEFRVQDYARAGGKATETVQFTAGKIKHSF